MAFQENWSLKESDQILEISWDSIAHKKYPLKLRAGQWEYIWNDQLLGLVSTLMPTSFIAPNIPI